MGYSRGQGADYGGFSVNINQATLDIEPAVDAYVASANVTAAGDVTVESESGSPGTLPDLSFDSGVGVDYDQNIITFSRPHGLDTGDSIIYRTNGHDPIGGLVDGATYQVIRVSDTAIQLGTFISADQVDNATGEIQFDLPHTFENGSAVVYDANGNPWINGLRNGTTYFINALDASAVKLASTEEIASNESIAAFNGKSAVNYGTNEITMPVSYPATGLHQTFAVGQVGAEFITTQEKSTSLAVGDAVMYAPNASALTVEPLTRFGVYYIAKIQKNGGGYVQIALAQTPTDAAAGNTIHLTSQGAGELVGVDVEHWQLASAGVNTPAAFVFSGYVLYGTSAIFNPAEPFPFVTGDQVSWVRTDGDYAEDVRFGLLPYISYYVSVDNEGGAGTLQLASSLEDLQNQKFITLTEPSSFEADPEKNNFFLALQIPAKTGDAFTYRGPQAISFSGDNINVPEVEDPSIVHSIEVTDGDTLNTLLLDVQNASLQPGEQHGLLGTVYRDTTVSVNSLSVAQQLTKFDPFYAFVASEVDYPRSTSNITDQTPLATYLNPDDDSLIGNTRSGTDPLWDSVFVFDGFLKVEKAGTYTFEVRSDDGFELKIDNQIVTNFTGTRAYDSSTGTYTFNTAGFYPISLLHYDDSGNLGIEFRSDLTAPASNGDRAVVPNSLLYMPLGLIYEVVSTSADAEAVAPLVDGSAYGFVPLISDSGTADAFYLPLPNTTLAPSDAANATQHQLRIPGNDPIPGLTDGGLYYVIADPSRPGVLQLAASRDDARNGIAIDLDLTPSIQLSPEAHKTDADSAGFTVVDSLGGNVSVAAAGDFNGDRLRDMLVTASSGTYIVFGQAVETGTVIDLATLDPATGVRLDLGGNQFQSAGDVNGDGVEDLLIGDAANNRVDVVYGSAKIFPATIATADVVITGQTGDAIGSALAAADVNGDGVDDLILGAADNQRSYVVFGSAGFGLSGSISLGVLAGDGDGLQGAFYDTGTYQTLDQAELTASRTTPDVVFTSTALNYPATGDAVSDSVGLKTFLGADAPANAPSTNLTGSVLTYGGFLKVPQAGTYTFEAHADDGFRLRIGSQIVIDDTSVGGFASGAASGVVTFDRAGLVPIEFTHWEYTGNTGVLLESNLTGTMEVIPQELLYSVGGYVIQGGTGNFGAAVSDAGDVNGDGVEDILIGDPANNEAFLVLGTSNDRGLSLDASRLDGRNGTVLAGPSGVGQMLDAAGDVNGDGYADVLLGLPDRNEAFVVFGSERFAPSIDLQDLTAGVGFEIDGLSSDVELGTAVTGLGDINRDGIDDFAIASPKSGNNLHGHLYVIFGSPTLSEASSFDLATLDGINGYQRSGSADNIQLGGSLAGPGDVNGDGVRDVLVGENGQARLLFGSPDVFEFKSVDPEAETVTFTTATGLETGDAFIYTGAEGARRGRTHFEYLVLRHRFGKQRGPSVCPLGGRRGGWGGDRSRSLPAVLGGRGHGNFGRQRTDRRSGGHGRSGAGRCGRRWRCGCAGDQGGGDQSFVPQPRGISRRSGRRVSR